MYTSQYIHECIHAEYTSILYVFYLDKYDLHISTPTESALEFLAKVYCL